MTNVKASKRILIEQGLSAYYSKKLNGKVWSLWDESKRAYSIRGENLPSDLPQYANGWSMSDYVTPTKAAQLLGLPAPREQSKRILSVTVKREVDCDPDTSYYGEYASERTSEYSIDRAHSDDCASVTKAGLATLEHARDYVLNITERSYLTEQDDACEILEQAMDEAQECDCSEYLGRGEYRYFNPSSNYVDANDKLSDGLTPDDVRKYVRQDYERMQAYNNQQWCYMGVSASAQVQLAPFGVVQTIRSGGLWGTESDSEESYFAELEQEQLDELLEQLHGIGFSRRAIAAAMRQVERSGKGNDDDAM